MKRSIRFLLIAAVVLVLAPAVHAEADPESQSTLQGDVPASMVPPSLTLDVSKVEDWKLFNGQKEQGPPLPFHTIEGYGGGAITPIAYLVNAGPKNTVFGLPAAAFSYVNLGSKDLEAFTATETLFGRLELGFGADRFNLGSLPGLVGNKIHDDVWLYNFNARFLAIEENSFNLPLPAITLGAQYKYNASVAEINSNLGNALKSIGYHRSSGTDFTLTASKTFPKVFEHPLIVTAGGRVSEASHIGLVGFGDEYRPSVEGNIVYLPTNWLLVAYEYRQKHDPYSQIPGLIGKESDWHAFDVSWIINKNATFVVGYGIFGRLANSDGNHSFWVQLKYEF